MNKRFLASIVALVCLLPVGGQAAPARPQIVDLPDTPLTSTNVHWVTSVHTGVAVGGKFATIGGKLHYFQTTARSGFYIPSGVGAGGVYAFDASNPEQPVLVGHLPIPGQSQNEDVELSERRGLLLYSIDNRQLFRQSLYLKPALNPCSRAPSAAIGATDTPADPAIEIVDGATGQVEAMINAELAKPQNRAISCRRLGGFLVVVDISQPSAMRVRSIMPYPDIMKYNEDGTNVAGPGHTASCADADCSYAYVSYARGKGVLTVDLRNPDAPQMIGHVASPAGLAVNGWNPGVIHDVRVDEMGTLWMFGSSGTAMYQPTSNPLKPKLLATVSPGDNAKHNQLIHHGGERLSKDTMLITEEDFQSRDCGASGGEKDGSFQTWKIDAKAKRLLPLGTWNAELATDYQTALAESPLGISCSSHWFDVNASKVVAAPFYEQGVRFLDVSNPKKIRQVGYWIPPANAAGQAQFVPGRNDLVYVSDYARGLDVLRIDNGGRSAPTATAPMRAEWFKDYKGIAFTPRFKRDEAFGWACKVPA